jgi:sulfatase modifying factor 1
MGIKVLPFHGKSRTTHKDCRTHMNSALSRRDFISISLVGSLGTLSIPAKAQESGKFVALIVGVSTYKFGYLTLNAGGDARKIDAALRGLGYAEPFLLSNIVNKGAFVELLKEVLNGLNPEDTFLFFFAGHGSRRSLKDPDGKVLRDSKGRILEEEYLLFSNTEDSKFSETALSISELEKALSGCVAQKRLFILDACRSTTDATKSRSGKIGFRDDTLKTDYGKFRERLDTVARTKPDDFKGSVAAAILWSCSPGEKSYEDDKGGVFTAQLVSALNGGVHGVPTATELRQYVLTHMPSGLPGPQTPDLRGAGTVAISPQPVAERPDPEPRPNSDPNPRPDPSPRRGSRLTDYPALRAYVESLRSIPAGTFQMGSSSGPSDEKPVHSVSLSAFRVGATPVTVAVWKEYCAATGTKLPDAPRWGLLDYHPVVNVSWNDIMGLDGKGGFCAWASEIAGFRLTLPTEAQFEYAARGGQSGLEYPWGRSFDRSKLWCSENSLGDAGKTAPVVRASDMYHNAYGLTDMSGNVDHWCSDLYGFYSTSSQTDPTGPLSTDDGRRRIRGGSWIRVEPDCFRCAYRSMLIPDYRSNGTGFRLAAGPS